MSEWQALPTADQWGPGFEQSILTFDKKETRLSSRLHAIAESPRSLLIAWRTEGQKNNVALAHHYHVGKWYSQFD